MAVLYRSSIAFRVTVFLMASFPQVVDSEGESTNDTGNNVVPSSELDSAGLGPLNATWILICSFLIFTMQSGFGLLESGSVSPKNEVNIMFKSACDLVLGGTVYWLVGYGLAFGQEPGANSFTGFGTWALYNLGTNTTVVGNTHTDFVFQLSFAATATTIASGAVAERVKLHSYIVQVCFNTLSYAIVSHWFWDRRGWLFKLKVIDIAGAGAVHCCGGAAAFVSSFMLGPRCGRYDDGNAPPPVGNGLNIFLGTFFLWWGWLAFNCGSVFGVNSGQWANVAKTATNTLLASLGGGALGITQSVVVSGGKKFFIKDLCNGVLGGLVGVTAACTLLEPWEAYVCGIISALIILQAIKLIDYLHIDDPVSAISVHGFGGIWGMLVVGLFMDADKIGTMGNTLNRDQIGLFHGGGFRPLGVQLLAVVAVIIWSSAVTAVVVYALTKSPLKYRLTHMEELLGCDAVEHDIGAMAPPSTIEDQGVTPAELFHLEHTRFPSFLTQQRDSLAHHDITNDLRQIAAQRKMTIFPRATTTPAPSRPNDDNDSVETNSDNNRPKPKPLTPYQSAIELLKNKQGGPFDESTTE